MFKKLTPLIVLGLFVIAVYFILQGMNHAISLSKPQKVEVKK